MRNRGKKWMAMVLAVIVTCVNLFISGGSKLEVYANSGNSEDFVIDENGVLRKYIGLGGDVVIPEGVTSIGERAFDECVSVTSVVIPDGVTEIGYCAFEGCSGLTSVSIPGSVTSLLEYAFDGCSSLTSVTIPDGVTSIYAVFVGCSSLTSVTIPASVTDIDGAFGGCSSLTSIKVDEKNTCYDSRENCNAIIETKTNTLVVGCNKTTIPGSVTSIGNWAFSGCSGLTSMLIPESVTSIGEFAFSDCSGLTSIRVDEKNTCYDSRENCNAIIETKTNTLVVGCNKTTIPRSVTSIGNGAFYGCSGLTSVTIPESVASIGDSAFDGCSGLISVTIPESVTSIGNWAFSGCSGLTSVTIPEGVTEIAVGVFSGCSGLTSVIIPEGITSIGYSTFEGCSGLTSVTIPESVTSIGGGAFSGCSGLTSVTIPTSVTSIGNFAFSDCSGLTSMTIPSSVTSIGEGVFKSCSGLTGVTILGNVTGIERGVFYDCSGLTSVTIPESITYIGQDAFYGCSGLTSVTIPASVTNISQGAFAGCSGLKSVSIPEGVTSIGWYAFGGCSRLTSVSIPTNVTSIATGAFSGCSGLTSITVDEKNTYYDSRENCNAIIETSTNKLVLGCKNATIPASVTSIGGGAFSGCSSLTSVSIPTNVTSIAYGAFSGCSGLTSITVDENNAYYNSRENCNAIIETSTNALIAGCKNTIISGSVTRIGDNAFSGCSGLTSVNIPGSVTYIGLEAFSGCSGLTSITVDEKNAYYDSRENCNAIIETKTNTLIAGCKNTNISGSVTSIRYRAFYGCSSLINVVIPRSVTAIGNEVFPTSTTLIMEAGSYGEKYAKANGYNYRTAFVCDAIENPVLTKEVVNDLIEKNSIIDIQILSNNNVQFTFAKGTMKAVEGLENYDFGTTVTTEFAEAGLPDSVTEEDFVAKISYNYSGQLPGEASIKIFVGEEYDGKRMEYSLLKEDNTRGESQSAKVDSEGYITVKQSHCSAYVITLAKAMMGDTNNDGSITAEDALAILKQVVGLEQLTSDALTNADVNADNAITAEDALDVLKKVVGLLDHFKAEETN